MKQEPQQDCIKTEGTTPGCPATKPHGPGIPLLIRATGSNILDTTAEPTATQPCIQQYTATRGCPDYSPRRHTSTLHRSHHRSPADQNCITTIKSSLGCTTNFDLNKYCYMCYTAILSLNNPTISHTFILSSGFW